MTDLLRPDWRLGREKSALCTVAGLNIGLLNETGVKPVVEDVSFTIYEGEYFALVGESGSGKSVTCHSLLRLLPFRAEVTGKVTIDGFDLWSLSNAELRAFRRKSVGFIFQDPLAALNPVRTIGSQMVETLRLYFPTASREELRQRAVDALANVHIPNPASRLNNYPHQLSGGQNQRVMIAFALFGEPRLLIADEPTTALDMSVQAEILNLLDELRSSIGLSILMVTHDIGVVSDRATDIAVMRNGRIIEGGRATDLLADPREDYTKALFAAAGIDRVSANTPNTCRTSNICLSFENVNKSFYLRKSKTGDPEEIVAADDISFTVREGEIVALVGESGSGKTTAAKMAMGLVKPDSGQIVVNAGEKSTDRIAAQMVFQHPKDSLDPLMKVGSQLNEVLKVHGWRDVSRRAERIHEVIKDVGLEQSVLDRRPTYLSGGEAQRVVIARALLLNPRLLIADEPLSAIDVCLQKQILACFEQLRDKLGIAILLITHDLRIVFDIADRMVVLKSGKVVEDVSIQKFSEGSRDPYTQRLVDAIPGRQLIAAEFPESPKLLPLKLASVGGRQSLYCEGT